MSWNPDRQLYVALSPDDIPVVSITPFDICLSSGQEDAAGEDTSVRYVELYNTMCDRLHIEEYVKSLYVTLLTI